MKTKEETTQLSIKDLRVDWSSGIQANKEVQPVQNNLYSVQEESIQVEEANCEDALPEPTENHVDLKCRLFSEQTSNALVSPKAAMCLAAALESDLSKGNKGAKLFQMLKQKSHEWIVDETNVKKLPASSITRHQCEVKFCKNF